jgi:hypothetical protein
VIAGQKNAISIAVLYAHKGLMNLIIPEKCFRESVEDAVSPLQNPTRAGDSVGIAVKCCTVPWFRGQQISRDTHGSTKISATSYNTDNSSSVRLADR